MGAFINKPLKNYQRFDEIYNMYEIAKFDTYFVQDILNKKRLLPPLFKGIEVLNIGNPEAKNKITLALNPTCLFF